MAGEPQERDDRPLVISLCGTYLKAEMQSIYRQIANLQGYRTAVFAERVENMGQFPHDPVVRMTKRTRPRHRGNFLLRFWFKYIIRKWPPPMPIGHVGRDGEYYHPYDLVDLLEESKPALVHVYYGHKAVKYRRMLEAAGVPWLVSFHGVDVVKFVDEPGYLDELKQVFAEARLVLARSDSLLDRLEQLGCPREKMRINRTPIPFDDAAVSRRTAPADGEWCLVQACRLIPKKGLFTVLEALPAVLEKWPKLKFIICGRGPIEEDLKARIAGGGLEENVELTGWVDQAELKAQYASAHAFLHPSELTDTEDQEGVPNSMLEAMAAGLPVISTLHGGIPEAVESGRDGFLVAERAPEELSAAILKLLADESLLGTMSEQAAASVREKFGLKEQIAWMEGCYREAIGVGAGDGE